MKVHELIKALQEVPDEYRDAEISIHAGVSFWGVREVLPLTIKARGSFDKHLDGRKVVHLKRSEGGLK